MIYLIDESQAEACARILADQGQLFAQAAGATHNHQTWVGGYLDHLREVMNLAVVLYPTLDGLRPLSFTLSDALLVLFLHDLEKPWQQTESAQLPLGSHSDKHKFRLDLARRYEINLTPELENAMDFIEGEGPRYTSKERRMGPLAAFCHVCDTLSARLWFDHPETEDQWSPPRGSLLR